MRSRKSNSQTYVVGKVIWYFTGLSNCTRYWKWMSSHKLARWLSVKFFFLKNCHIEVLLSFLVFFFYVISSSTPLLPFTKRIPSQLFLDSTARKHSHSLNGKFSSVHSCHCSVTDHGISDVITTGLIQSTRPQTYFFTIASILSCIWTHLQPFPED